MVVFVSSLNIFDYVSNLDRAETHSWASYYFLTQRYIIPHGLYLQFESLTLRSVPSFFCLACVASAHCSRERTRIFTAIVVVCIRTVVPSHALVIFDMTFKWARQSTNHWATLGKSSYFCIIVWRRFTFATQSHDYANACDCTRERRSWNLRFFSFCQELRSSVDRGWFA